MVSKWESSQKALLALDNYLKRRKTKSGGTTEYDVSYVAHSIGCSAVLQHAVSLLQQGHLAVHRIVLVSPFTTMVDMAKIALLCLGHPMSMPRIFHGLDIGSPGLEDRGSIGRGYALRSGFSTYNRDRACMA